MIISYLITFPLTFVRHFVSNWTLPKNIRYCLLISNSYRVIVTLKYTLILGRRRWWWRKRISPVTKANIDSVLWWSSAGGLTLQISILAESDTLAIISRNTKQWIDSNPTKIWQYEHRKEFKNNPSSRGLEGHCVLWVARCVVINEPQQRQRMIFIISHCEETIISHYIRFNIVSDRAQLQSVAAAAVDWMVDSNCVN